MSVTYRPCKIVMQAACLVLGLVASNAAATFASNLPIPSKSACAAPSVTSPIYTDVHEQIAQTSSGPIGYYRFGHGSPILLVTGFRATISEWNAQFLSELAKHNEVVVFDNRGMGRSIPEASDFSVRNMANDTDSLIHALKLRHPTVVGWSMGGIVVQKLAIDDPASIGQMVLWSTLAPGKSGTPVRPRIEAMLSGTPGVTFDDVMSVLFPSADLFKAAHCFRQEIYEPSDYHSPVISNAVTNGQSALLKAWSHDESAAKALSSVRIRTLILSGSDDDVVSVKNSEALRRLLPDARLVTIDGAGHAMMYQYPVVLAQKISAFAKP